MLSEPTSRMYTDPAEMRAEYDLIMQWLARRDISRAERRMLEIERNNLAPQFATDRARVAGEQRVARLQAALTPSDQEAGRELQVAARVISSISRDDTDPGKFWIYQNGERIPISADQASRVRGEIDRQLRRASRMISGDSEDSWNVYQSQLAVNRESPIIGAIAGWLGGASDPGEELIRRRARLVRELRSFDAEVAAGDVVGASGRLARLERQAQVIHGAAAAFRDNHISGAERAIGALEITRDISFAVAGSIAAVLAAPLVAGAVAGAGITGAGATALTIGGTGLVVGGGEAVVRGGASAGGVLVAGGTVREAGRAFVGEGARGFLDGFMAGAGAGAARVLGPALGIGGQVGNQVLRRMAAEAIVNGTAATIDAVIHGASPAQAAQAGLRAAVLALPGAVVGSSGNRLVRELGGPLAGGATAYLGAIAAGQSRDEALRAAAVAVAANIVTSRAQHGAEADQRLEARGRAIGESLRPSPRGVAPGSGGGTPPVAAAVVAPADSTAAPAPVGAGAAPAPAAAAASHSEPPAQTPSPHAADHVQESHPVASPPNASAQTVAHADPSAVQAPSATATQAPGTAASTTGSTPAPAASAATSAGPRESAGAAPPGTRQHTDPFTGETAQVTASARAPSAVHGHIRGAGAEFEAYHTALRDHGEIGIQRPGRVNEGGPDFITARVLPNGTVQVIVSDATINLNKRTYSAVPTRWYGEIDLAVAPNRLQLGDPALEAQIRAVVAARVFTMRNLEIRTSPTATTAAITGW
ncbi:MAG TPA: hypothetical protein VJ850_08265 [Candidatus Limnocylindrales bacterium]|nr:hypothetical protein [Candidatus Limnocylindrales bacterium]